MVKQVFKNCLSSPYDTEWGICVPLMISSPSVESGMRVEKTCVAERKCDQGEETRLQGGHELDTVLINNLHQTQYLKHIGIKKKFRNHL